MQGSSHPIQIFSYAVKLQLEFVVLNQLMAVAARGLQRENFEERRYHHGSAADAFSAECREWDKKQNIAVPNEPRGNQQENQDLAQPNGSFQITLPSPVLSREHQTTSTSIAESGSKQTKSHPLAPKGTARDGSYDHGTRDRCGSHTEPDRPLEGFFDDTDAASYDDPDLIRHKPSEAFSGETLGSREDETREKSSHPYPRRAREAKEQTIRSLRLSRRDHGQQQRQHDDQQDGSELERTETRVKIKRRIPKNGRHSKPDEDEEEETGVHMWENRKGSLVLEVPWFKSKTEP